MNRLLFWVFLCLTSCEKVIDVNLNYAAKKYVIEGVVTNQPGTCKVLLSQTKNFDETNGFIGVGGALVTITDNTTGVANKLTETSAGVYQNDLLTGRVAHAYTMNVQINGQTFTASSVMEPQVNLDSIYITNDKQLNNKRKLVNVKYHDPLGKGNSYRFIQYINGVETEGIFIRNDELTDGKIISATLRYSADDDNAKKNDDKIKTGDTIRVEMLCIDPAVYKYWYSFDRSATGANESASPANPITNIEGGALGYFSAHTLQQKTMIVY